MIKSVATKRKLYGTIWNIGTEKTPTTLEHVERIQKCRTFVKGIWQESGMRPQVVNLLFLFSRKLWMTWKAQRNSTISAAPEEEQSVLDFRRRQSHRSRHRIRAMTLRLLGKFFSWYYFLSRDYLPFLKLCACPGEGYSSVLEKINTNSVSTVPAINI